MAGICLNTCLLYSIWQQREDEMSYGGNRRKEAGNSVQINRIFYIEHSRGESAALGHFIKKQI